MTQDEIIRMARELVTRHGTRMCDEDGETHGEELYCVDVDDIAEIIKQVAAHEREKHGRTKDLTDVEIATLIQRYTIDEKIMPFALCEAAIAKDREKNRV